MNSSKSSFQNYDNSGFPMFGEVKPALVFQSMRMKSAKHPSPETNTANKLGVFVVVVFRMVFWDFYGLLLFKNG